MKYYSKVINNFKIVFESNIIQKTFRAIFNIVLWSWSATYVKFNTKNVIQMPSTTFCLSFCRCFNSYCVKLLTLIAQKNHKITFLNGLKETVTTLDFFLFLVCPQGLSPVKYLYSFPFPDFCVLIGCAIWQHGPASTWSVHPSQSVFWVEN